MESQYGSGLVHISADNHQSQYELGEIGSHVPPKIIGKIIRYFVNPCQSIQKRGRDHYRPSRILSSSCSVVTERGTGLTLAAACHMMVVKAAVGTALICLRYGGWRADRLRGTTGLDR
jgi:hypothetical protein